MNSSTWSRVTAGALPLLLSTALLGAIAPAPTAAAAPRPRLGVTQTVDPTSYDRGGQRLTWTSVVTNFGDVSLVDLAVTDASTRLSARTCTPTAVGGTLAAGASTTCTATSTVTQADVDARASRTDAVTAAATTKQDGTTYQATASATVTSEPVQAPHLALAATTDPTSVARIGQPVAYTFVARNTGNQTLRGLVVTAPFPGLSALVCTPVALGGALAPGATTTCRATRTTSLTDLQSRGLAETAKATGHTSTTAVNATAVARLGVAVVGPRATDDAVSGVVTDQIVLAGSSNDSPGSPGGPPINQGKTVLIGSDRYNGKQLLTNAGTWTVGPDGRVRLSSEFGATLPSSTVTYRVYDMTGRSATAHLTFTALKSPAALRDELVLDQGTSASKDVLANDNPGTAKGGGQAALDPASLRLTGVPSGGPTYASVSADGAVLTIPFVGTWKRMSDGRLGFSPLATFAGESSATYAATSSNGGTETGTAHATVSPVTPTAADQTLPSTAGQPVTFPAARQAHAGRSSAPIVPAATVLVAPGVEADGKTYVDAAGTWTVQGDGSVRMVPAVGYAGSSSVDYAAVDRNGTRVVATLTVAVRERPRTVPASASTPQGTAVTLAPLPRDTAGQRRDGTRASFDPTTLVLLTDGLPPGSTVTADGRTLTVPGQGVWTVATAGTVAFAPTASFTGATATVTYRVRDDAGSPVDGTLAVAVTSAAPVATDDALGTPAGTPVRLAGATNDVAGAVPLDPAKTLLPADGQPAGSTRAPGGKSLTVSGQGTWTVGADGSVTFTPLATFVGPAAAVAYQLTDTSGATSRASLRVVVRAGAAGREDTVRLGYLAGSDASAVVAANDIPGGDADGTLGSVDVSSVRFPTDQPIGWSVQNNGTYVTLVRADADVFASVDPAGVVHVNRIGASAAITLPLRYTVSTSTTDATGTVTRRTVSSTLLIELPVTHPRAVDDVAGTPAGFPVILPGTGNDVPGDPGVPLRSRGIEETFPADQPCLALPKGCTVDDGWHTGGVTVPGQGRWVRDATNGPRVVFFPEAGFVGETTPVVYAGTDITNQAFRGTLQVLVRPGPAVRPDAGRTVQGVPTTVDVLANDDPGQNADGTPAVMDRDQFSLAFGGLPKGSTISPSFDQITVPGQGTWTAQRLTGRVRFTPVPSFTGTPAPMLVNVAARVRFPDGRTDFAYLDTALTFTVDPVTPTARADQGSTEVGVPLIAKVLANDAPGAAAVPLVGSSVRLRTGPGLPAGSTLSGDAKRLDVPGRGVFLVSGAGQITFVPLGTETGPVAAVGYSVADANGTTARSTLTVQVTR
ncbi:MAG TPA: hypothetical protein VGC37_17385 [Friedmanniella sp.]